MTAADRDSIPISVEESALVRAVDERGLSVQPQRALLELVRRGSDKRFEIAARVAVDPSRSFELRAVAVQALGEGVNGESQRVLIGLLGAEDPFLTGRVALTLGRVGDRLALEALEAYTPPRNHPVAPRISFAKSLISYRLGLGVHRLRRPPASQILEVDPGKTSPMRSQTVSSRVLSTALPSLQRQVPGVAISTLGGTALVCPRNRFWLVFTEVIETADFAERLRGQNGVLALLFKFVENRDRPFVHEIFLSHPSREHGIAVFGVRPTGNLCHVGAMQLAGREATLHLRTVNTPVDPALDLQGRFLLDRKQLILSTAVVNEEYVVSQKMPQDPIGPSLQSNV